MILGVFTGLNSVGGVQRIGRHTAAVLASFSRERDMSCRLLALNDPPGRHQLTVGDASITFQGFGRQKGRFVLAALGTKPRPRLTFIGHPNLAPLGLLSKLLRPTSRYLVATYGIDVWERLPLPRRLGLRSAHGVTTLSQFTAERMRTAQKIPPGKVTLLPPALDPEFLSMDGTAVPPEPPLPSGRLLLTVSRLETYERDKGLDTVIRAMPMILRSVPDAYHIVIGDGDERVRLERLARDTGVAERVLFVGAKTGHELAGYYKACDVFVMPSRKEGFGVVFLEAMAFGKPVVACNYGGTPEVVVHGVTGILLEYGDVDALADGLIQLLGDEDLRRGMGEAGRQRVEEHYTFEHFRRRLVEVLTGAD